MYFRTTIRSHTKKMHAEKVDLPEEDSVDHPYSNKKAVPPRKPTKPSKSTKPTKPPPRQTMRGVGGGRGGRYKVKGRGGRKAYVKSGKYAKGRGKGKYERRGKKGKEPPLVIKKNKRGTCARTRTYEEHRAIKANEQQKEVVEQNYTITEVPPPVAVSTISKAPVYAPISPISPIHQRSPSPPIEYTATGRPKRKRVPSSRMSVDTISQPQHKRRYSNTSCVAEPVRPQAMSWQWQVVEMDHPYSRHSAGGGEVGQTGRSGGHELMRSVSHDARRSRSQVIWSDMDMLSSPDEQADLDVSDSVPLFPPPQQQQQRQQKQHQQQQQQHHHQQQQQQPQQQPYVVERVTYPVSSTVQSLDRQQSLTTDIAAMTKDIVGQSSQVSKLMAALQQVSDEMPPVSLQPHAVISQVTTQSGDTNAVLTSSGENDNEDPNVSASSQDSLGDLDPNMQLVPDIDMQDILQVACQVLQEDVSDDEMEVPLVVEDAAGVGNLPQEEVSGDLHDLQQSVAKNIQSSPTKLFSRTVALAPPVRTISCTQGGATSAIPMRSANVEGSQVQRYQIMGRTAGGSTLQKVTSSMSGVDCSLGMGPQSIVKVAPSGGLPHLSSMNAGSSNIVRIVPAGPNQRRHVTLVNPASRKGEFVRIASAGQGAIPGGTTKIRLVHPTTKSSSTVVAPGSSTDNVVRIATTGPNGMPIPLAGVSGSGRGSIVRIVKSDQLPGGRSRVMSDQTLGGNPRVVSDQSLGGAPRVVVAYNQQPATSTFTAISSVASVTPKSPARLAVSPGRARNIDLDDIELREDDYRLWEKGGQTENQQ